MGIITSLKAYTTWGIGGEAELSVIETEADACTLPVGAVVLGKGSNVLVSDGGVQQPVYLNRIRGIRVLGNTVTAGSGETLAAVAKAAEDAGLSGLEWAAGIPGSVGGAVYMNAGAFGSSTADVLHFARAASGGRVQRVRATECGFSYRESLFMHTGGIVTRAGFALTPGDRGRIKAETARLNGLRRSAQPSGKSAGSVYRGGKYPAGYYIDRAGLKGAAVGGAQVSTLHANFILNTGGATAADVLALMHRIEDEVYTRFSVRLRREIRLIGEF